jgi:hypothetical protein
MVSNLPLERIFECLFPGTGGDKSSIPDKYKSGGIDVYSFRNSSLLGRL